MGIVAQSFDVVYLVREIFVVVFQRKAEPHPSAFKGVCLVLDDGVAQRAYLGVVMVGEVLV